MRTYTYAHAGWDNLPVTVSDKTSDVSPETTDTKLWSHKPAHASVQRSAAMASDVKDEATRVERHGGVSGADVRNGDGDWRDAAISPPGTLGDLMSAGDAWDDRMIGAQHSSHVGKSSAQGAGHDAASDAGLPLPTRSAAPSGGAAERVGRGNGSKVRGGVGGGGGVAGGPGNDIGARRDGNGAGVDGPSQEIGGDLSEAAMKRGRVVTWKDRRGAGKLEEERIVSGLPGGAGVSSSSSKPNASVSKWSTPSKDVRGGASKEWTEGVSGETAQLLQVLLGVQPSVPAGRLGERDGRGSNGAEEERGAGRDEMRRTWQAILALEEEEAGGKMGGGGGSEVLTSDDEGEPVHSAACLLEEEEEDASPSHPAYPQWQISLLSPAVEEVRGLRRLMRGGVQTEACTRTCVCAPA
jgi:hypothetical protein